MSRPGDSPLVIRARALRTLSEDLRTDAQQFHDKASRIAEGMMRGASGDRAYGADSRNLPALQAITAYTDVTDDSAKFMSDVATGLADIGRCVTAIAASLGAQDDDNADRVRRVLGLDPRSGGSREA